MRHGKSLGFFGVSACHALATVAFALAGERYKVLLSFAIAGLWLVVALQIRNRTLTVKSMTNIFLALAAIYLLTAVDYALDAHWIFAAFNFAAFLASGAVAVWINRRFSKP